MMKYILILTVEKRPEKITLFGIKFFYLCKKSLAHDSALESCKGMSKMPLKTNDNMFFQKYFFARRNEFVDFKNILLLL